MKLLRFFADDNIIKTGYFDGKKVIELADSIENILNNWETKDYIEDKMVASYSLEDIAFAPVYEPTKIVCIGLNYKDHAEELAMELPDEPKIFLKPSSSIIGCDDDIVFPNMSNELDYEDLKRFKERIHNHNDFRYGGFFKPRKFGSRGPFFR